MSCWELDRYICVLYYSALTCSALFYHKLVQLCILKFNSIQDEKVEIKQFYLILLSIHSFCYPDLGHGGSRPRTQYVLKKFTGDFKAFPGQLNYTEESFYVLVCQGISSHSDWLGIPSQWGIYSRRHPNQKQLLNTLHNKMSLFNIKEQWQHRAPPGFIPGSVQKSSVTHFSCLHLQSCSFHSKAWP